MVRADVVPEFVERDRIAGNGWPIGRADLDSCYPAAARVLDLAGHEFETRAWMPRLDLQNPPVALDGFDWGLWQLSAPTRLGDKYRAAFEASARTHCVLGFTATRLTMDRGGERIQSVTCRSLAGRSLTVKASVLVLAMGGIESARLPLLSRDQRPAGLGNESDLVGRNFLERPAAIEGAELYVWKDGPGHEFFAKAGKGLQSKGHPAVPSAGTRLPLRSRVRLVRIRFPLSSACRSPRRRSGTIGCRSSGSFPSRVRFPTRHASGKRGRSCPPSPWDRNGRSPASGSPSRSSNA